MKLYTLIEPFGPSQGERWSAYVRWRGLPFRGFESIDGILRPSLFSPESEDDWEHVCGEDHKILLITDFAYAARKRSQLNRGDIVGLGIDGHDESDPLFLGYDLIDGFLDVSLLTNWGNDVDSINRVLGPTGLIRSLADIESLHAQLLATCGQDAHVEGSRIISIYATPEAP